RYIRRCSGCSRRRWSRQNGQSRPRPTAAYVSTRSPKPVCSIWNGRYRVSIGCLKASRWCLGRRGALPTPKEVAGMSWFERIFRRRRLDDDLAEELLEHIEERTEQIMRLEHLSRPEARQAALRAFGNPGLVQ